jgi:Zn-dependent protease with chaperone function
VFAARGLILSLAVFTLVYACTSLMVPRVWKFAARRWRALSAASQADRFLTLRMLPLLAAALVTFYFTVPSFLLFEPRGADEDMSVILLLLGAGGLFFLAAGIWRAAVALARTSEAMALCTREARVDGSGEVPVVRIAGVKPAVMAAGIAHPKVLLSEAAEFLLTPRELQTALRHELGHIRRHDNVKKLALCAVAFPGMAALEAAWSETSEMAADDAAVGSEVEALDLAAALIKLSQLVPTQPAPLMTGLLHGPAKSLNARVARLLAWQERPKAQPGRAWRGMAASLAVLAGFAVVYSHLLLHVHAATEWLVR